MSLQHFFLESQVLGDETDEVFALDLTADDLHHAQVLRLKPGEHIVVIDGQSDYFECEIVSVSRDSLSVRITSKETQAQSPFEIWLVQGLAKGEKMDTVIRQVTEIGVAGVLVFQAQRSTVKLDAAKAAKRRERWEKIGRSAAMQSGRRQLPTIAGPLKLTDLVEALGDFDWVIIGWEEAPLESSLAALLTCGILPPPRPLKIAVVVGPEGGLTTREVEALAGTGARSDVVSLGETILRTETAGVLMPALVKFGLELETQREAL